MSVFVIEFDPILQLWCLDYEGTTVAVAATAPEIAMDFTSWLEIDAAPDSDE